METRRRTIRNLLGRTIREPSETHRRLTYLSRDPSETDMPDWKPWGLAWLIEWRHDIWLDEYVKGSAGEYQVWVYIL